MTALAIELTRTSNMKSVQPYRDALSLTAARAELRRNAGTQFCPEIVAAFEGLIDRGQIERVLGYGDERLRRRAV